MSVKNISNNYKDFKTDSSSKKSDSEFGSILGFLAVIFITPLLLFVLYIISIAIVGAPTFFNGASSTIENAQSALWFTMLGFITTVAVIKWSNKKRASQFRTSFFKTVRSMFFVFAPIVLLGTGATFVGTYMTYGKELSGSNSCSLPNQLQKTLNATYPIQTDTGSGTAFAIDANGTLLTAYHVVEGAKEINMSTIESKTPVTILSASAAHDIALLKYPLPTPEFLPLVDSYPVGEAIYAVGYPGNTFTAGQASVSQGIVSRILENNHVKLSHADAPNDLSFIQTDAAINPGNSGGALISKCGAIGVVSAVSDSAELHKYNLPVSEQNISFAISSKTVKTVFGIK